MLFRKGFEANKFYIIIAFFVIIVIILTIILSNSGINPGRVPFDVLDDNWSRDTNETTKEESFLGLEKWISFTYRANNDSFPSYVTVTTMKNFFMMNEDDLIDKTEDIIIGKASDQNIFLDKNSRLSGSRVLKNGHKTMYIVYNGTKGSGNDSENVKIIGETWNCEKSGTSIVCVGMSQVTNSSLVSKTNFSFWGKIVRDKQGTFGVNYKGPDGLIFSTVCH